MKEGNGNSYWTRWLVSIAWGGIVTCLLFLANYTWSESSKSRERDQQILDCHNKDMMCIQKETNIKFETIIRQIERMDARQQIILDKVKSIDNGHD